MKIYKTAIIGGGAAGLMTAVELLGGKAPLNGNDVVILERNDRVGKKLIATGNGQGNLTNENISSENYYGDKAFIDVFLDELNELNLEEYLYRIGIPLCTSKDGKKYPLSKQANSVLDVIRAYLNDKNCQIATDCEAYDVKRDKDIFIIRAKGGDYFAKTIVFATGGKVAKQFGTDGTAFKLIKDLGHSITELYPSLVQLKTELEKIRGLKGLKENAKVTAFDGKRRLKNAVGDILFTEYGVSGNAVFQVSSSLTTAREPSLCVELLPELSYEQTYSLIKDRLNVSYICNNDVLVGIINKRIGQAILKTIKGELTCEKITDAIKNFTLKVTGNLGFNYAQVTKGGINTDEINARTMESRLIKNLFVVGEALDVDGDCGGYNLTFAFCSGIIAGKSIKKSVQ